MRILSGGQQDLYFTKIEIDVPRGVQSVEMASRPGWSFTYENETLTAEEQLAGHYGSLSTRPTKVIMEAEQARYTIKGSEIMLQHFGARFGCFFDDADTNSFWRGFHTVWWGATVHMAPVDSLVATSTAAYTACGRQGTEPWFPSTFPLQRACAYTFVYSSDTCATIGPTDPKGMSFLGSVVPPAVDMAEITNEAHVLELVDDFTDALFENIGARLVDLEATAAKVDPLKTEVGKLKEADNKDGEEKTSGAEHGKSEDDVGDPMSSVAYVALSVSIVNFGAFLSLFLVRVFAPASFHSFTATPTDGVMKAAPAQP